MGTVDRILNKRISKKLMVFAVATALTVFNYLDAENWVTIATIYIGTQGVIDAVAKLRKQ